MKINYYKPEIIKNISSWPRACIIIVAGIHWQNHSTHVFGWEKADINALTMFEWENYGRLNNRSITYLMH